MIFSEEIICSIEKLIDEIKKESGIINKIIRDDVLSILHEHCTVLYYPLEDECDGCHLVKPINGKLEQFVFINTNNTRERLAFTAAHELGHIWKVDERIRCEFPDININTEELINRFAAELLMPRDIFQQAIDDQLKKLDYHDSKIPVKDLVRLIAYLMNNFFVPYKAVVFRFNELDRLNQEYNDIVLEYKDSTFLKEVINAEQYTRLGIINKNKSIDNLQEFIVSAEQKELISANKARNIRDAFGIETVDDTDNTIIVF